MRQACFKPVSGMTSMDPSAIRQAAADALTDLDGGADPWDAPQ